jgi:hypothetical protein
MLLRGALTAGKIGMGEDLKYIVGPAFIEAFDLERKNAIYPRIIFADEIKKYIPDKSITFKYIAEDNDKFKYLDFINHNIDIEKLTEKNLDHLLTTQSVKAILKSEYEKNKSTDKLVAQKYGWLISKLASHKINII